MAEDSETTLHSLQLLMERFDNRLTQFSDRLARIEKKTDALHKIVAGNGSDASLVMRLRLAEKRMEAMEHELQEACSEVEKQSAQISAMRDTVEAWRNRAIGIGLAMSVAGGLIALLGARIIQLVNTP